MTSTSLCIPSNLGETKLYINIVPGRKAGGMQHPVELSLEREKDGWAHRSFIWVDSVEAAQWAVISLSKQLEKDRTRPIQNDRFYFLSLLTGISYKLHVTPKKNYKRPIVRVALPTQETTRHWQCHIYASNLMQLLEATSTHERNLLKKQSQTMDQR